MVDIRSTISIIILNANYLYAPIKEREFFGLKGKIQLSVGCQKTTLNAKPQ